MKMQLFLLLIISVFASEDSEPTQNSAPFITENIAQNAIVVKIEEDEYIKKQSSHYIGASYNKRDERWYAQRWSKNENKSVHNGAYKDEETAARASDTLARKLIANGEKCHNLNFLDDFIEVYPEKTSKYFGVTYNKREESWRAQRHNKNDNKPVHNGTYKDEETAAHASDTLARKLIANGEKGHKLNFPDDSTEVNSKKTTYQRK